MAQAADEIPEFYYTRRKAELEELQSSLNDEIDAAVQKCGNCVLYSPSQSECDSFHLPVLSSDPGCNRYTETAKILTLRDKLTNVENELAELENYTKV